MTPKTPDELRKQVEKQAKKPAKPGHERTAEGMETPTPTKSAFLKNLLKVTRPGK